MTAPTDPAAPVGDPVAAPQPAVGQPPARRRRPFLLEVALAVLLVAVVQALLIKPFGVPSQSMEETLQIGDRILVNRLDHTQGRGDVVVFGHGETWATPRLPRATNPAVRFTRTIGDLTGIGPSNTAYTVKRIIGLPGETVACCDASGAVTVDGKALREPYVYQDLPFEPGVEDCASSPRSARCFPPIRVPAGNYLVLGDHRSESADSVMTCRGAVEGSSCAQFVAEDRIVGPVVLRFWPLTALGPLP